MVEGMTTKNVHSAARNFVVLSAAALLVWVAVRMAIGTGAQAPTVYTFHQGASVTAPVAAPAPVDSLPVSNPGNSAGSAVPTSGATVAQQAQPVAPTSGGSPPECLLTGPNVPSKSYVRGGCLAH
jgi:hypothetical protein